MTLDPLLQSLRAAVRDHPIELAAHLLLWGGYNALMISGDSNGVGYFHQPGHSLVFPMLHGTVWNAATFLAVGLWLLPRLFERRWGVAAAAFGVLTAAVLCGKTLAEWLYIRADVADLRGLSLLELGLENFYAYAAALILGLLYFVARRGILVGATRSGGAILLRSGTSRHRIELDAIRYLKAEGNYVAFHADRRPLLVLMTMSAAIERLPPRRFLRIHRSYAVNLAQVTGMGADEVHVGGERLPIGRRYLPLARRRIAERLRATVAP